MIPYCKCLTNVLDYKYSKSEIKLENLMIPYCKCLTNVLDYKYSKSFLMWSDTYRLQMTRFS